MATIKKTLVLAVTIFLLLAAMAAEEERCEQQFRSQQQLAPCQDYLRDSTRVGTEWRQQFQQCCQLLDRMDEQCRCQGISRVVEKQGRQQVRGEELREMMKTAESLPGLCRVGPQRCEITAESMQAVSF